jgi:hypothetical protein
MEVICCPVRRASRPARVASPVAAVSRIRRQARGFRVRHSGTIAVGPTAQAADGDAVTNMDSSGFLAFGLTLRAQRPTVTVRNRYF